MDKNIKDTLKECINNLNFEKCIDHKVGIGKIEYNKFSIGKKWIKKSERIESKNQTKIKIPYENKTIVIVLESPHIEEFSTEIIGPALGKTGKNLDEYLDKRLNKAISENKIKLNDGEYDIILCNAIQYRASLGINTEYIRDRVWINLWVKNKLRLDFKKRVEEYNPYIVFNLCTLGSHKKELIYSSCNKVDMSSIRYEFIKNLNLGITQNNINGELELEGNVIFLNKYIVGQKKKVYPLKGFVSTIIDEVINEKGSIIVYDDCHPSSRHFLRNK